MSTAPENATNRNLTPPDEAWQPISVVDEPVRAFAHRLQNGRENGPHRIALWRGLPGTYRRAAGMPWSETFVVYKGRGTITIGTETVDLAPGVVIDLAAGAPYVMTIEATLEKMAVIVA